MVSCNTLQTSPMLLYDPKVTVWCTVWSRGVNGPYFSKYEDRQAITVTSQHYTEMINEFLVPKLPPNHDLWLQQDGAMVHMALISTSALRCLFPQQMIYNFGDVTWCPSLLDLTAPDFFMQGHLKRKVYCSCPVDLNALKKNTRWNCQHFRRNTLRSYEQVLNPWAPLHSGGWWPPKTLYTKSETM